MRLLVLCLGLTGCWPYISGPYDPTGTGTDTGIVDPGGDKIASLRAGDVALGAEVDVRDVEVTAIWALGFYAQDPRSTGSNAGIHVFLDGVPPAVVGERVSVLGTVDDYFGELQIAGTQVDVLGSGTGIEPVALSPADAATEAYEGMLVEIDGEVTQTSYNCSVDVANCADRELWEVGGSDGVLLWNRCFEDEGWGGYTGRLPVVGVQTMRFERRRIMPRTGDDF